LLTASEESADAALVADTEAGAAADADAARDDASGGSESSSSPSDSASSKRADGNVVVRVTTGDGVASLGKSQPAHVST
jgi:hypothetical protein